MERYSKHHRVAMSRCPQCEYIGISVEMSKTLQVYSDGYQHCGLCGYKQLPNGNPVPSTIKVINKEGTP